MPDEMTTQPELLEAAPDAQGSGGTESAAATPRTKTDELKDAVERLERERDEYRDLLLRTRAEFDNFRKRLDRERQEQAETAAAGLLGELLPIVDDLERALAAHAEGSPGVEAYRAGVELIHRRLLDLLRQHGVTPIEAVGTPFDPRLHEAVTHEPVPGRAAGEVAEEYRRGYLLGSRLLRPSMVKVAAPE